MYLSFVFSSQKTIFFVKLGGIVIFLLVIINTSIAQPTNLKILKAYPPIKSSDGWDYIAVHEATQRLFVAHSLQVNVLNTLTGNPAGIIPHTIGGHGVAFVDILNKGFTSNFRLNNVYIFNLHSLVVENSIATGENPDAIFYNGVNRKIYTCNGRSKDISVIDPFTNNVVATIPVSGKPETAVADEEGNVYMNIEEKNEIIKISSVTHEVMTHWSIAPAEEPAGLVYDAATYTLFARCGNKMLAVADVSNGIAKKIMPIGA